MRFDPDRLRRAREASGLSRESVAEIIGRSYVTVYRYENGEIPPSAPMLGWLAKLYGVPVAELYDRDDSSDPVAAYQAKLESERSEISEKQGKRIAGLLA